MIDRAWLARLRKSLEDSRYLAELLRLPEDEPIPYVLAD